MKKLDGDDEDESGEGGSEREREREREREGDREKRGEGREKRRDGEAKHLCSFANDSQDHNRGACAEVQAGAFEALAG